MTTYIKKNKHRLFIISMILIIVWASVITTSAISGPSVEGASMSVAVNGESVSIVKKGTYEIVVGTASGANGQNGSNQNTGAINYGGIGGKGQQVTTVLNLEVGDTLLFSSVNGAAGLRPPRNSGGYGGNGGAGITVMLNDAFLLSAQGGSGGGGGGYYYSFYNDPWFPGGNGGAGGYTINGTCINNPVGGGAGGTTAGGTGPNGTGIYADLGKIISTVQSNGAYSGALAATIKFVSEYKNHIEEFNPTVISVKYGTTYEQIISKLPITIQTTCTQGIFHIPVSWACDYFDPSLPGTYIFSGILGELPEDVENPQERTPVATIELVNVGPEQTFDIVKQLAIPTINVIKGQEITKWLSTYDDMDSVTQGTIQIINEDKTDQVIQLIATINTAGSQKVVINGYTFIFNVIEEPDSSNVDVTFN